MGNPTAIRIFDRLLGVLLRPALRRVRRWGFLVTVPAGLLIAHALGLHPRLADSLLAAAALIALDIVVLVSAATLGTRLLGRERRDALLDLLMHPLARRAMTGELRLLGVYPRALLRRLRPRSQRALCFSYHRRSPSLAIAIAMLPPIAAETAVIHLLLPHDWLIARIVLLGLGVYSAIVLVGLAIGERVYPHELTADALRLRAGTLYSASIPLDAIASVTRRRDSAGARSGLVLDGDRARLTSAGRTDLELTLRTPVTIERPVGDPVSVTAIAFAADDAAALEAALSSPPAPARPRARREGRGGWLTALDAAGVVCSP